MEDEQSLLEQVRQKEGELKKKFETIHDLNEKKITEAKRKQLKILPEPNFNPTKKPTFFLLKKGLSCKKRWIV